MHGLCLESFNEYNMFYNLRLWTNNKYLIKIKWKIKTIQSFLGVN